MKPFAQSSWSEPGPNGEDAVTVKGPPDPSISVRTVPAATDAVLKLYCELPGVASVPCA